MSNKVKNWYVNRYYSAKIQRNLLFLLLVFSVIATLLSIFIVKYMIANRSLVPYIIHIDKKSSIPTVIDQDSLGKFTGDEIIQQYFISKFVISALSYDIANYKINAENVRLLSSINVYNKYASSINLNNIDINKEVKIDIISVNIIDDNKAVVTINKITKDNNSISDNINEQIMIRFSFVKNLKLTFEERMTNPMGFQITDYRILNK